MPDIGARLHDADIPGFMANDDHGFKPLVIPMPDIDPRLEVCRDIVRDLYPALCAWSEKDFPDQRPCERGLMKECRCERIARDVIVAFLWWPPTAAMLLAGSDEIGVAPKSLPEYYAAMMAQAVKEVGGEPLFSAKVHAPNCKVFTNFPGCHCDCGLESS